MVLQSRPDRCGRAAYLARWGLGWIFFIFFIFTVDTRQTPTQGSLLYAVPSFVQCKKRSTFSLPPKSWQHPLLSIPHSRTISKLANPSYAFWNRFKHTFLCASSYVAIGICRTLELRSWAGIQEHICRRARSCHNLWPHYNYSDSIHLHSRNYPYWWPILARASDRTLVVERGPSCW